MSRDIWFEGKELPLHSVVMIFFNEADNLFLLEQRPLSNHTFGGETVFPGEKGAGEYTIKTVERGVKEEMGDEVRIIDYIPLQQFSGAVGDLGQGIIQSVIITKWLGEIRNLEPEKGKHIWVNRDEVMTALTYDASKHLFWIALADLGLLQASDFENAPKMNLPSVI